MKQQVEDIIEEVVNFQNGVLNNSVDTMTDVVKVYKNGMDDIKGLQSSLEETKTVLTAKKSGQISMRELWLKKKELEEAMRIMGDIEWLKDSPLKIQRLIQQKRYLNAVIRLNKSMELMFSEDLVNVTSLTQIREQLLEQKGYILESIVTELRDNIIGTYSHIYMDKDSNEDSDSESQSDTRSEVSKSITGTATATGTGTSSIRSKSILPSQKPFGFDPIYALNDNGDNSHSLLAGPMQDLLNVDETIELSITDSNNDNDMNSSELNNISNCLLVKAIGLLHYEEDVERLLLESIANEYQKIIQRIRIWSFNKLRKHILIDSNHSNPNEDYDSIINKLFHLYVNAMLNSALLLLQKLLYVLQLLNAIKYFNSNNNLNEWKYLMKENISKNVFNLWFYGVNGGMERNRIEIAFLSMKCELPVSISAAICVQEYIRKMEIREMGDFWKGHCSFIHSHFCRKSMKNDVRMGKLFVTCWYHL